MNKLGYCVFSGGRERRDKKFSRTFAGLSFGLWAAINGLSRAEVFSMTSRSQTIARGAQWYRAKFGVQ